MREVRTSDGELVQVIEVNLIDRVEEALRAGAFVKDAAARIGVDKSRLWEWQKTGVRAQRDLLTGVRRHSDLSRHEKQCAELAARMESAEAEARLQLLALGQKLAQGGFVRREVTKKVNATGQVLETTTKESVADPEPRMIQWLLSRRWPEDFNRNTIELTGADGAPLIDGKAVAVRLAEEIAAARANRAATEPEQLAGTNGNGHHPSP